MTITNSGPRCDVCGKYILPGTSDSINPFECTGIKGPLHCHDDCKVIALEAVGKYDWKALPPGPLRKAFEENEEKKNEPK